jgi:urease accessory protein
MIRISGLALTVATVTLTPALALAHTGIGQPAGFAHGLMHPIGGIDHVLAMIGVGLFAALLGGRALWLVPASFVAMMALGGTLGLASLTIPFVELGIGLSVVAFGIAVAARLNLPVAAAMAFVGFFAMFHGHAHGAEIPDGAAGLGYGLGFLLATAVLHVAGIALGWLIEKRGEAPARRLAQVSGVGLALSGVAILTQLA